MYYLFNVYHEFLLMFFINYLECFLWLTFNSLYYLLLMFLLIT